MSGHEMQEDILSLDCNKKGHQEYKCLTLLTMMFITIFIVCDITAFRMTIFWGTEVPVSGLIIPVVFSLGDIIAEVYGYRVSRKLIWNSLFCQFLFGVVITFATHFDSPPLDARNIHYEEAFRYIIHTNLTSCLSVSSGMFTNAFLMSKLKIWMSGKRFWVRTILSSSISELVLCTVAYTTLYFTIKPLGEITRIIITVWYYKLIFAIIAAPLVSLISSVLKKIEGLDRYDFNVNYNPFLYN